MKKKIWIDAGEWIDNYNKGQINQWHQDKVRFKEKRKKLKEIKKKEEAKKKRMKYGKKKKTSKSNKK